MKSIYVIGATDGMVKIGVSKNPKARIKTVTRQSGRKIDKCFTTEPMDNAHELEVELHKIFKSRRIEGEWFRMDFDVAVQKASEIYKERARFPNEHEEEERRIGFQKFLSMTGLRGLM